MKPVLIKIIRQKNKTIINLRTFSYNADYINECIEIIFVLLNLARDYTGKLCLKKELNFPDFPEIEADEEVAVEVQVYFESEKRIDEFIEFIKEVIP